MVIQREIVTSHQGKKKMGFFFVFYHTFLWVTDNNRLVQSAVATSLACMLKVALLLLAGWSAMWSIVLCGVAATSGSQQILCADCCSVKLK